ncbi:AAEL015238-PA [Aedes aegypti]|uniref:UPF0729 protein AAEL015238 n=1 Tax=Aedes aegypti TaxID=7159 RepID=U729_AEDAE|nr:UPF0729 protein AAEL015238 [Aedes aegypti]Q16EE5.1 RecName: Full=UPF0729 protein AAEL015238 [Aedes aegypti]EAT32602.1 AAEL015238-PA [Aedes aegypti]
MVCVPCFIIPVLLFLWHRFIQPYVLRFWNPWEKKDKDGNVIKDGSSTEFPFQCKGGVCPFPVKDKAKQEVAASGSGSNGTATAVGSEGEAEETKKSQ